MVSRDMASIRTLYIWMKGHHTTMTRSTINFIRQSYVQGVSTLYSYEMEKYMLFLLRIAQYSNVWGHWIDCEEPEIVGSGDGLVPITKWYNTEQWSQYFFEVNILTPDDAHKRW